MNKTELEYCIACETTTTVKYIISECRIFEKERTKFNVSVNLAECLNNEPINVYNRLQFIKTTNLDKIV